MVVKGQEKSQLVRHLKEVFNILRIYRMRLNPKKCPFNVSSRQFLGQIVNKRGIKPNLSKVEALRNMLDPRTPRDVQEVVNTYHALAFHHLGESPFSLTYGTEAVIPTEIKLPTFRTLVVESNDNEQQLAHNLDVLEEQ
ncbi:unnamed protein product [Prunus armeniaca]